MRDLDVPPTPIDAITSPFVRFARMEAAGGIVLLAATVAALVWANSPWQHSYVEVFERPLTIGFGRFLVTENWHAWINDGLMALFFFLVGLEIKREVLVGELSSLSRAALPFVAAIGGMVVPALIYLSIAQGEDLSRGWAVPISTDIAFTLGTLAFLGNRVPISLKVFVTALAIVDDIFAVIVIAAFYTSTIHYLSLALGLACIVAAFVANLLGVRNPAIYATIGIAAWLSILSSGVHATIAGVLLAFTIPAGTYLDKSQFLAQGRSLLSKLDRADANSLEEHSILDTLERKIGLVESPLHRIEQALQPWISFLVMPLFALANAGVNLFEAGGAAIKHPLSLGIVFGLVLGKPAGIWLFSILAVKSRLATSLAQVSWRQVLGAACLCGIGFTMSIFVAGLAFNTAQLLDIAKIAILAASLLSAILGCLMLTRRAPSIAPPEERG
ncbi:MAG: Na+/H+ antiporter NhaA [Terracidiphilus sp.]